RMADSPVVLMAGASPRGQRGTGAFQEVDQVAAARPVAKAAWSIEDPARAGDDVTRALAIAASGRPGPVYLSLPGDVLETDAAEAGVTLAVAAGPGPAAERLAAVAATRAWPASSWRDEVERARRATPPEWEALRCADAEPIHPLRVCAALAPHVEAGALLVAD